MIRKVQQRTLPTGQRGRSRLGSTRGQASSGSSWDGGVGQGGESRSAPWSALDKGTGYISQLKKIKRLSLCSRHFPDRQRDSCFLRPPRGPVQTLSVSVSARGSSGPEHTGNSLKRRRRLSEGAEAAGRPWGRTPRGPAIGVTPRRLAPGRAVPRCSSACPPPSS